MKMKTCRFCKMSNYDYNHPAAKSAWVKYSVRHSAHLKCALEAKGPEFFSRLTASQLEALPYMEVRDLGMEVPFLEEIMGRGPEVL